MNTKNFARYMQFALVILAAGAIYPLIYLKAQYQETILEVFNMTLTQMNWIYSIIGMVFVVGYFPSGLLSDKFSAKNLLSLSLLGTAIGGFWFAQVPEYEHVIIIFAIWGFFSVFTFWSSHLKVVKMLSSDDEDGRFFGILDGGKGLVEAILASLALALFTAQLGDSLELSDKKVALETIIYMYSAVLLVTSILIFLFVKEDKVAAKDSSESEANKFKFSDLGKVFKNKYIYLHGMILFCGYVMFWTNYYFAGHLQTNLGLTPVAVGSMMVGVLWMRPIGGVVGGFLADKIGKALTIAISLVLGGATVGVLAMAPSTMPSAMLSALVVFSGLTLYVIRGTYWSLLGQSKIDTAIMGTAIGVISFIGYLPDIALPQINSVLWEVFGNEGGYKAYFLMSMCVGFFGAILAMVYRKMQKSEENKAQPAIQAEATN